MKGYTVDELLDLADDTVDDDVVLGSNAANTGVVLPAQYQPGQLLTTNQAERLGAQLLAAAQLHDAIAASGSGDRVDDDAVDAFARAARRVREAFAPPAAGDSDRRWVSELPVDRLVILWVAVGKLLADYRDMVDDDVAIARDLRRTFECELGRRGRPVDATG